MESNRLPNSVSLEIVVVAKLVVEVAVSVPTVKLEEEALERFD